MDPNTALDNIIRGHLIADHAAALQEWLMRDGFVPATRALPDGVDCAQFVVEHCTRHYFHVLYADVSVRANRDGLWTMSPGGQWISLAIWADLRRLQD